MQDYNKNLKPLVTVAPTKAPFKMKSENLAPVEKPAAPKSAFNMPTNEVTMASSAKLQKASRLGGRATISGGSAPFAK